MIKAFEMHSHAHVSCSLEWQSDVGARRDPYTCLIRRFTGQDGPFPSSP